MNCERTVLFSVRRDPFTTLCHGINLFLFLFVHIISKSSFCCFRVVDEDSFPLGQTSDANK